MEILKNEKYIHLFETIFVDLADMQLVSKYNKKIQFLLCGIIHILSKYAGVFPLKVKKHIVIVNAFQKFLDGSNRKPKNLWIYNKSINQ